VGVRRADLVAREETGLAGYAIGCACSGYYLVRLVSGEDIRRVGSGTAGATNVGRRLGPIGFAATFLLDCVKGVAVGWGTAHYGLGAAETSTAILAVVSGHVWPVQLGFRGGKGIATSLGAFAAYDARIVVVIAGLFALWFILSRGRHQRVAGISARPSPANPAWPLAASTPYRGSRHGVWS
jgi:glycerol-3-phosphate acyltransferase PlsY